MTNPTDSLNDLREKLAQLKELAGREMDYGSKSDAIQNAYILATEALQIMEVTGHSTFSGQTEGHATREGASPVTSTNHTLNEIPEAEIRAAIKETQYKYFGDYEFSTSQTEAVCTLVSLAEAHLQRREIPDNASYAAGFDEGVKFASRRRESSEILGDAAVPDSDMEALNKLYEHIHGLDSGSADAMLLHRVFHYLRQYRSSPAREEDLVLKKIAFTCERTGKCWQFDSMTKFIEAFLDATQPAREIGKHE